MKYHVEKLKQSKYGKQKERFSEISKKNLRKEKKINYTHLFNEGVSLDEIEELEDKE